MTPTWIAMLVSPGALMLMTLLGLDGIEQWTAAFGSTADARVMLGRFGIVLPFAAAAALGILFLFAARGTLSVRSARAGVLIGGAAAVAIAASREMMRLSSFALSADSGESCAPGQNWSR